MPPANRAQARRTPDKRARSTLVTTVVLILLAVMIVRDILVRRWGLGPQPPSDVTQRSL
ncbi:MAG: hypothetical protein WCB02_17565 [Bradyrhizobium sp.]